jgi:signal transduction histidine kinase
MTRSSILVRLVLLHVVTALAMMALLPFVINLQLHKVTNAFHDNAMESQAELLASAISLRSGEDAGIGNLQLDLPPLVLELFSRQYDRYFYSILASEGTVLFSSLPDRSSLFPARAESGQRTVATPEGPVAVDGVSVRIHRANEDLWVQVAEKLGHREVIFDDVLAHFLPSVAWTVGLILLAVAILDVFVVLRALSPLNALSALASRINPRATNLRLPTQGVPREVRPLVEAINQALFRLDEGYRSQREFTADVAHELRTPLAILQARIDAAPDKAIAASLASPVANTAKIVDQLLELADAEAYQLRGDERADLPAVAAEVVAMLAPMAIAERKEVALECPDRSVFVRGNAEMLFRATRNLADNALKHSAPGDTVEIVVDDTPSISVRDSGPGIPEADRARIFERFWRKPESGSKGFGIGLAIVKRIVELHQAKLRVEDNHPRGSKITIAFRDGGGD